MWMEGKGRALSEAGVRMGRTKESGESGTCQTWSSAPLWPSRSPERHPRRLCSSPVCRAKVSQDPSLEPPEMTSPPRAGRGLRALLGLFSLSWGALGGLSGQQPPSHLSYQCLLPVPGGQGVGKAPSERPPPILVCGWPASPTPLRSVHATEEAVGV